MRLDACARRAKCFRIRDDSRKCGCCPGAHGAAECRNDKRAGRGRDICRGQYELIATVYFGNYRRIRGGEFGLRAVGLELEYLDFSAGDCALYSTAIDS